MSHPQYVFDTNIFIYLQRWYPPDIFGSLWAQIESLFDNKVVISSDEVIEEIEKGNDNLIDWVKARPDAFYQSNEQIQLIVRDILTKFSSLVTGAKKPNAADPFVIALAKHLSCTLITDEKHSGSSQSPKIPNICDVYNVKYMKFFDFLRTIQIRI